MRLFNPGELNKRIQLLKYDDVENCHGTTSHKLVSTLPNLIWAKIEPYNGRDYQDASKDKTEDTLKITIRYRPGINNNMLVRYRGIIFNILNISDPAEKHEQLILTCSIKSKGKNHDS